MMASLRAAIAAETGSAKRQMLENAAVLMEQLTAELKAYRAAAEYDYSRPTSMQFRGWNMGQLQQALRQTEAALTNVQAPDESCPEQSSARQGRK